MEDLKRGGYVKKIAAAAGHTGYKDQSGGSYVPFRLYLAATSLLSMTMQQQSHMILVLVITILDLQHLHLLAL
jgi:hypothetical protein